MTFDDSYEKYKVARNEVRMAHSALSKKLGEREQIDGELPQLIRTYKRLHRNLEAAQLALIPELDKEVAAHTRPAKIEEIVARVVGTTEENRKIAEIEAHIAEKEAAVEKNQPADKITDLPDAIQPDKPWPRNTGTDNE